MPEKLSIWDLLSRTRNSFWALETVGKIAVWAIPGAVVVLGLFDKLPISILVTTTIVALAATGALVLMLDSAVHRWKKRRPDAELSQRTLLLCKLRDEAKVLRDAVMVRHDAGLDNTDVAFKTIFHVFPEKLKMYVGADSERDYIRSVGKPTHSSESIKVAADIAFATIEQITALQIQYELEQAASASQVTK